MITVHDDEWDPGNWPLPPPPTDNAPIFERDGGWCLYRVPGVCRGGKAESVDHRVHGNRRNRAPSNLVSVCGDGTTGCHGWKEAHPDEAAARGWTVSRHGADTTKIPILLWHPHWAMDAPRWFRLGDDYTLTPEAPDAP